MFSVLGFWLWTNNASAPPPVVETSRWLVDYDAPFLKRRFVNG